MRLLSLLVLYLKGTYIDTLPFSRHRVVVLVIGVRVREGSYMKTKRLLKYKKFI